MRANYVSIVASLKFILKLPVYVPLVEKEQCHYLMDMASQFGLEAPLVRRFMRVLCKISRKTQRKMHVIWSLEREACVRFLVSQLEQTPMLQWRFFKSSLQELDNYALFFCQQLIHLLRFYIRFVDLQILSLFSSLREDFSLNFVRNQFQYLNQYAGEILLYKLFLLMNGFVKKEKICC